ncbi:MAG TPA: alpha-L-arabinofuranosidase C-terminal domain-containing protein [Candidatus Brocadiia bacterium]|nr:alpha-L-arabinofuranosidase C-terminal domain-containing protein [Candidatus Brocadiia bacterium]
MRIKLMAILTAALLSTIAADSPGAEVSTITIHADKPGPKVSPGMYGIFFEEINHAGDGGLYAEMIRNRAFEDARPPEGTTVAGSKAVTKNGLEVGYNAADLTPGWTLVLDGGAEGAMSLEESEPLNDATPRNLRIETKSAGDALSGTGRVGVANSGYWGISVREGEEYALSFFTRGEGGFAGPLAVSLEHASGNVLAQGEIGNISGEWKKHECVLKANATESHARLVIATTSPGAFRLDAVSLFPRNTWKGRTNGLRVDLAEKLAGLKPGFVRFPGGCFVEGITLQNAYHWKKTIGPIETRPGHWCLWNYQSTDGLGYHEYLLLCEDLGASAMYVANCGMSCQGRKGEIASEKELNQWIQDAIDAIEYAIGPADSKWGAVRTAAGHPKPFDLRYVEIGNENGGPDYNRHYGKFFKAIKERYPQIITIANSGVISAPMEILDEHYYSSPQFFIDSAFHYDKYDRKGPKVYVGEYACTQLAGTGNLNAAIGEAAFMTGMENNADMVVMASYAPLFVNVNDRCWNPDLIGFDGTTSYGTPSYYAQKLFGTNRPDYVVKTNVKSPRRKIETGGPIGLGTWRTQSEFKDVKVTSGDREILADDFSGGLEKWRVNRGEWNIADGALRQSSGDENPVIIAGDPKWSEYTITLKARKLSGEEGFMILFHARDDNHFYWWNIGGWSNRFHGIERANGGRQAQVCPQVSGSVETGRWYDVKVEVKDDSVRCWLDGKLIHELDIGGAPSLFATAGRLEADGDVILKVVNVTSEKRYAEIAVDGVESLAPQGSATVLTSDSPNDENSLAEPTKVAPRTRDIAVSGKTFRYTFPPVSLTVIRLKAK